MTDVRATPTAPDPAPLSRSQISALVAAAARELRSTLPAVSREVRTWRGMALRIPDAPTRADALGSLDNKRGHTDGAALLSILPRQRHPALLRLLVAYETIWDFLDNVSERGAGRGERNGLQLHRAFVEALDPRVPLSDYYRFHPWKDDGGYLRALVTTCREACATLPSYERVRPIVLREARRGQVQALNHHLDDAARDARLEQWARREFPAERQLAWFELAGASSASLVIHVLLALAADPGRGEREVADAYAAYYPWPSLTTTLLDSYVDLVEDARSGGHSYVAHYPDLDRAIDRTRVAVRRSLTDVAQLPNGERHVLIVACMVAMYLSKDTARAPELRATTRELVRSGGSLTRLLMPILRCWRIAYGQRSA